ncbi:hypothetical protein GCM10028820_18140 [Tessaracoccus terricola]
MELPTPTLETHRLRLRPFTADDAEDLFELQSDARPPPRPPPVPRRHPQRGADIGIAGTAGETTVTS